MMEKLTPIFTALFLTIYALPAVASGCPPPLEYAGRKADLREALRVTRDANAGRYLTRSLLALWATAPNRRAQALLDEGMAKRAQGDLGGAAHAFTLLIGYCPDYAEGYNQRARVRFQAGDYARALADLESTLARAPDHAAAMAGKAMSLMRLGRFDEGRAALDAALALNPWLPERRLLQHPPGTDA